MLLCGAGLARHATETLAPMAPIREDRRWRSQSSTPRDARFAGRNDDLQLTSKNAHISNLVGELTALDSLRGKSCNRFAPYSFSTGTHSLTVFLSYILDDGGAQAGVAAKRDLDSSLNQRAYVPIKHDLSDLETQVRWALLMLRLETIHGTAGRWPRAGSRDAPSSAIGWQSLSGWRVIPCLQSCSTLTKRF